MFRVRDTSFQQNPVHKESECETECVEEKKTEKKTSKNKNENAKISNSSGFQMKYDHTNQCDHF